MPCRLSGCTPEPPLVGSSRTSAFLGLIGNRQIEKLDDVAETLEELWISYNQISALDGLSNLSHLTRLYISNNAIKNWAELDKLVRGQPSYTRSARSLAGG